MLDFIKREDIIFVLVIAVLLAILVVYGIPYVACIKAHPGIGSAGCNLWGPS